jgi:hypothetical protein
MIVRRERKAFPKGDTKMAHYTVVAGHFDYDDEGEMYRDYKFIDGPYSDRREAEAILETLKGDRYHFAEIEEDA